MMDAGVAELIDFMPIDAPAVVTDNHKIIRGVRCVRGQMPFALACEPRFDFARQRHKLSLTSEGAVFDANGQQVVLHGATGLKRSGDGDVRLDFAMKAAEVRGFMLETAPTRGPQPIDGDEVLGLVEQTVQYWRSWLAKCTYRAWSTGPSSCGTASGLTAYPSRDASRAYAGIGYTNKPKSPPKERSGSGIE